jgi:hypothetical protein
LANLGIASPEITTMINMNQALTCLIGLANGPVFRTFTFRQVSFFGATLVVIALFFTSFADSFVKFLITFSILYGKFLALYKQKWVSQYFGKQFKKNPCFNVILK